MVFALLIHIRRGAYVLPKKAVCRVMSPGPGRDRIFERAFLDLQNSSPIPQMAKEPRKTTYPGHLHHVRHSRLNVF